MQINYGNLLNANATIKPEVVSIETNDGHCLALRCFVQDFVLHIVLDDIIVSPGYNSIVGFAQEVFKRLPHLNCAVIEKRICSIPNNLDVIQMSPTQEGE
jgi:hypothetical protein